MYLFHFILDYLHCWNTACVCVCALAGLIKWYLIMAWRLMCTGACQMFVFLCIMHSTPQHPNCTESGSDGCKRAWSFTKGFRKNKKTPWHIWRLVLAGEKCMNLKRHVGAKGKTSTKRRGCFVTLQMHGGDTTHAIRRTCARTRLICRRSQVH